MKSAVVTGGSSGIGQAMAERLVELGYRVYSLARRHREGTAQGPVVGIACDLTRRQELARAARTVLDAEPELEVLVNNAGLGRFAPHEEIPERDLVTMVELNLLAPMLLTRHLLRRLRANRGTVVNVCSVAGLGAAHRGAAYAATKAGLIQFGEGLFEECRKCGLRVVNLVPDIVATPFYDQLDFGAHEDESAYLTPECLADALETALTTRRQTVITRMTLRPQRRRIQPKKRGPGRQGNQSETAKP